MCQVDTVPQLDGELTETRNKQLSPAHKKKDDAMHEHKSRFVISRVGEVQAQFGTNNSKVRGLEDDADQKLYWTSEPLASVALTEPEKYINISNEKRTWRFCFKRFRSN
ncbi:hypothetical protein TWF506_007229 [Arthrobotrys conoides]|uniref:Uncharacterized protein n=1 Tax=Arthrobotrys conoides TaxID=74498 RepID=A0AAN8NE70_9PEZI